MQARDEKVIGHLQRIESYLRELASYRNKERLLEGVSTDLQKRAYELTDGTRSASEIAEHDDVDSSKGTVRNWWSQWRSSGLMDESDGEHPRTRYNLRVLDEGEGE